MDPQGDGESPDNDLSELLRRKSHVISKTYGEFGCSFQRSTNCLRLSLVTSIELGVDAMATGGGEGGGLRLSHACFRHSSAVIRALE